MHQKPAAVASICAALALTLAACGDSGPSGLVRFAAPVASVNMADSSMTLADNTVVQVTDSTTMHPDGECEDLETAENALANQQGVTAEGHGTVESNGSQQVITAHSLRMEFNP